MKTISLSPIYFYSVVLQFATEHGMQFTTEREQRNAIENYVQIAIWYN